MTVIMPPSPLRTFFRLSRYDGIATVILMIQLSTREVEKIAARVFNVPDTDALALRARLENLRKKGCPHGLATGRGKVAKFDFEQLADVSIALALIDAGLSPRARLCYGIPERQYCHGNTATCRPGRLCREGGARA